MLYPFLESIILGFQKQEIEIAHSHANAMDIVETAYKKKKSGYRQYSALSKHAAKHSEEHIGKMLSLMEHKTLREAHKEAMKQVGA